MRRILLALAAALACAAPAAAQQPVSRGAPLDPTGLLRIWAANGAIHVIGWDRDSVAVTGTIPDGRRLGLGGSRGGVKAAIDGMDPNDTMRLEVRVPRRAQVWVKTGGADVTVTGVAGSVDVYSVTGAIRLDGDLAAASLESMGGAVTVTGAAASLRAKTASGGVRVAARADDAVITTVSGSVRLEGARLRRARVETVDGAVVWAGPVAAGSALEIGTHGGAVELALPRGTAGEFTLSTFSGTVRNGLAPRAPVRRTAAGRSTDFTLGTANGTQVAVRTFRGGITLRRQ